MVGVDLEAAVDARTRPAPRGPPARRRRRRRPPCRAPARRAPGAAGRPRPAGGSARSRGCTAYRARVADVGAGPTARSTPRGLARRRALSGRGAPRPPGRAPSRPPSVADGAASARSAAHPGHRRRVGRQGVAERRRGWRGSPAPRTTAWAANGCARVVVRRGRVSARPRTGRDQPPVPVVGAEHVEHARSRPRRTPGTSAAPPGGETRASSL